MSNTADLVRHELVVADDGSIPADQIASLGLRPGARFRVVREPKEVSAQTIAGSLPDWPDLTWEQFEKGSQLAQADARQR
jgi:hypothetical protein